MFAGVGATGADVAEPSCVAEGESAEPVHAVDALGLLVGLLIGLLARADPGFVAGDFATVFRSASGPEGETGSSPYFPDGFWEVSNDGVGRYLLAPWGMRVEPESGLVEEAPGRRTPPRFPPWSLVLTRYSTFLGREHDDWQLDAGRRWE